MQSPSRIVAAFKEKYNLVGMASTVALSLATLNPLPLLAGLVLEAGYLLYIPDMKWYINLLERRKQEEILQHREEMKAQIIPTLRPEMRNRFQRLETTHQQICAQTSAEQKWFVEATSKFDDLLMKFLVFASKESQFQQYLFTVYEEVCGSTIAQAPKPNWTSSTPTPRTPSRSKSMMNYTPDTSPAMMSDAWVPKAIADIQAQYQKEMDSITQLGAREADPNTKAVLAKRLEIIQRRSEFLAKIDKTLVNLHHQLQLLEDTFGLISDEIRARSPEQILQDIDDVVSQTDTMTRVLEELAPYEQMVTSTSSNIRMTA
ncbi:MAG: hypothetical protein ACYDBB_03565 [Armatimonadota bacterium]